MTSHRNLLTGGALAVLGVLFVAVILISNSLFRGARLDLTSSHLYTLSQGTKNIISSIDEPVHLYLFYSDKGSQDLPQLRVYAQRAREMLEEMSTRAGGKLKLEVIDPQPFSEDEDRATGYGLQAVPSGQNGEKLFLGLAGTNSTTAKSVIPFLQPNKEAFLEYDVAKLIHELSVPTKAIVGLVSGLPMGQSFDKQTRSMKDGRRATAAHAVVRCAPAQRRVDQGHRHAIIDVVALVHPKKLTDDALYAIDQFVMRGGYLSFCARPGSRSRRIRRRSAKPASRDDGGQVFGSAAAVRAWGVEYDPHKIVLDRKHALQISVQQGAPPVSDPAILGFRKADLNSGDVTTANLDTINISSAGYFQLAKDTKAKLTPLIQTSDDAMTVPTERVKFLSDPSQLLAGYAPTKAHYVIAGRLEGKFASAFPERKEDGHLAETKADTVIVLVGDTDMLTDRMWVQVQPFFRKKIMNAFANNGDFFINSVDNLTGSSDLIAIRGRATSQRPFTVVEDMKASAEESFRNKEHELQQQLNDTERKLTELQSGKSKGSEMILSPEQQSELTKFQDQKVVIRKQLRQVRHSLDENIDALGARLKFLNIGLMPLRITIAALAFAMWARRRASAMR